MKLPDNYYHPRCYWAQMVTLRCNAGCGFCILNTRGRCDTPDECTAEELLAFWNSLEHRQGQPLSLIGGEPTLYPGIVDLINGLEGYAITLTTNCKSPFYNHENFTDQIKLRPTSSLRINTSFHPHFIQATDYVAIVAKWKDAGYELDQISYVDYPDVDQFSENLLQAKRMLPLVNAPYMGFYDRESHFNAPHIPENNQPSGSHFDKEKSAKTIGFRSLEDYNDMTGQSEKREVECFHPALSLMISPDGYYYRCHYHLYQKIDPICHISDFTPVRRIHFNCRHYGFCEPCDVSRLGGKALPNAKPLLLNCMVDEREKYRPEIISFLKRVKLFCAKQNLQYDDSQWFELAYAILYSGHRHRGRTLWVGKWQDMIPQFLKSEGYKVECWDEMVDRANLENANFDLILCFDVPFVPHENLLEIWGRNLVAGGIIVFSTIFWQQNGEKYQPSDFYTESLPLRRMGIEFIGKIDYGSGVKRNERGIGIMRKEAKPLPNPEAKSTKKVVHKWR